MKKVGRGSAFSRYIALVASALSAAGIYIVIFLPFSLIFGALGGEIGPYLNPYFMVVLLILYVFFMYLIFFGDSQMSQVKRWFLNLDDNGSIKTVDKIKLYFNEFGKRELILTAIALFVTMIGTILDIKVCGFICIPAVVFIDTLPFPIAIVLGWVLFYTEYLLALILRFKKWDKDRLHKQGANI